MKKLIILLLVAGAIGLILYFPVSRVAVAALAGSVLGVYIFGFILLPLIALMPGGKNLLVNNPDYTTRHNGRRVKPHFFTELLRGRCMCKIRGGNDVEYVANANNAETEEMRKAVVERNRKFSTTDELVWEPNLILPWNHFRAWKVWMYFLTGLVFTGVFPLQRTLEFPLNRWKFDFDQGKYVYISDYSDHVRIYDFVWFLVIEGIEASGKIPLRIILQFKFVSVDPIKTLWRIDRWEQALEGVARDTCREFVRKSDIDKVLAERVYIDEIGKPTSEKTTEEDMEQERLELIKVLKKRFKENADNPQERWGIQTLEVEAMDISADEDKMTEDQRNALAAEGFERQRARGEFHKYNAEALGVQRVGDSIREGGGAAVLARTTQARKDMARHSGKGVIVLDSQQERQLEAPLFNEVRQLAENVSQDKGEDASQEGDEQ